MRNYSGSLLFNCGGERYGAAAIVDVAEHVIGILTVTDAYLVLFRVFESRLRTGGRRGC